MNELQDLLHACIDKFWEDSKYLRGRFLCDHWRPIETAPKNGTDILAVENGVVGEAYFNMQDDNWWWANIDPHDFDPSHAAYPTHWMPMPLPPSHGDTP